MIALQAMRQPADAAAVQQAWQALDAPDASGVAGSAPCAHLGVEAGVSGLHPLQATLLSQADWSLHLFDDGIAASAHTDWGRALFALEPLHRWTERAARGRYWPVREALRAFSALFKPADHPLLVGALRFDAHRLVAGRTQAHDALGLLMGGRRWLQRDGQGAWWIWDLALPDDVPMVAAPHAAPRMAAPDLSMRADAQDAVLQVQRGAHAERVRRSLPRLASGELVSLTLSQSYWRRVERSARQAYDRLREVNPAPGCFYLHDGAGERVFGASPDLQLALRGRVVTSFPVCGTVAREPGAVGAAESLRELLNESVDAAALAVCTDALRSDLAPWCVAGTLRLMARRAPMFLSTVVHTVDALQGELREGAHAWDLILATAAPAMVTGTPRASALRAIEALEAGPRGWYGGMVVQMQADGDALAVTLLRAATVRDGVAEVRTGGDLLADSDPEREEAESWLKTRSLWRAFGLVDDAVAASAPAPAVVAAPGLCVALADTGAAFSQGLTDALTGLGLAVMDAASAQGTAVRILTEWRDEALAQTVPAAGHCASPAAATLALGDAALQCLAVSGAAVHVDAGGRGRLLRCRLTGEGGGALRDLGAGMPGAFRVASHASRRLGGPLPAGWQVWAVDAEGAPLMLARTDHRVGQNAPAPCLLMLFRPDSLLSDAPALALLRAAVQWLADMQRTSTSR